MRTKVGLLSRVSTLALIAAAGSFGTAGTAAAAGGCVGEVEISAPTTISTDLPCAFVDDPLAPGDVINDANVGPGSGKVGFFVGNGGVINGALINNETITGGTPGTYGGTGTGALTIAGGGANVTGGVFNFGQITSEDGHGIALGYAKYYYDYNEQLQLYIAGASMTGNIVNAGEFAATINGGAHGVAAFYGTMSGALINNAKGTIKGGDAGVYIADTFTSWTGGIQNRGSIDGDSAGIHVGGFTSDSDGVVFSGGILNKYDATISSLSGPTIVAGGSAFSGGHWSYGYGIYNAGVITQRSEEAANGEGTYAGVGILVTAETFNDGIYNTGRVDGLGGPAIWITSHTYDFNGGIKNAAGGQIVGDKGIFIESTNFNGNLVNELNASIVGNGCGCEDAAVFADTKWNGNVENAGLIQSVNADGFHFKGSSYNGNFTNTGTFDQEDGLIGGKIIGAKNGVVFAMPGESRLANGEGAFVFTNSGLIEGTSENGVDMRADAIVAALSNTSTGEIKGGNIGMKVSAGAFDGTITNSGQIIGDSYGVHISAGTFSGDFLNTASGHIEGNETGAYISAATFEGNITNNGQIIGGGFDTGLHIVTKGTHTGAIANDGLISAASNALHVEIGEFYTAEEDTGTILNTGTIRATGGGEYESESAQTAVLLNIGNGATFRNADGGLILGDVVFDGEAEYTFVGEEGRIEGDLVGYGGEEGNYTDDRIIVRNGEQYFGNGTASDFASFTVENGGTAHMGGPVGGYAFENVNALNVDTGGTLYIARPTTLIVAGDYTQQEGSTLAFFLGAPTGISTKTGSLTAGNDDYGQLIVNGTAFLDGRIAGELDPAFASANPGLDRVVYNDVVIADQIEGSFDEAALLGNSAIFQLSYDINPGVESETVDLFVTRTPLGHTGLGGIIVETTVSFDNAVSTNSVSLAGGACGIAGPGWCVNRYAANEAGATQVMTDATPGEDPFSWLRAGSRRVGETAAWGRAVGGWGDTDGDATTAGSKFDNVGAILGVDHTFTPILLAGLAVQWTATDIDFKGRPDKADVDSLEVGAYASWGDYRLYLNANVSYIWHEFDVRRFIGPDRAFGDYDGQTFSTYAEGGKTFETDGGALIQPFISFSFSHLDTDAYAETGTNPNVQLNVRNSDFDSLRSTVGARIGYPIKMSSGRMMVPEARAGWSHEFLDDQSTFLATLQGGPPAPPVLVAGEEYSRDTLVLGGGITVPIADQVVAFADYDAGLNDDVTTHTVSGGVRVKW